MDYFVKAVELGPSSVMLMAGDSTLPASVATELSRPLIQNMHKNRASQDVAVSVSVLEEIRQVSSAQILIHRSLPNVVTETLVAGHFGDGSPALILVSIDNAGATVRGFRPVTDNIAAVGIGVPYVSKLLIEAIAKVNPKSFDEAISVAASIIWDAIKDPSYEGIGGGLLVGYKIDRGPWIWPMVKVEQKTFFRGLPVGENPPGWEKAEYRVSLRAGLRELVEERDETWPLRQFAPEPVFTSTVPTAGESQTTFNFPPDWHLTPAEKEVLGIEG